MKVSDYTYIATVHNLQQGGVEVWQETKGANEKRSIDNWVVHQAH